MGFGGKKGGSDEANDRLLSRKSQTKGAESDAECRLGMPTWTRTRDCDCGRGRRTRKTIPKPDFEIGQGCPCPTTMSHVRHCPRQRCPMSDTVRAVQAQAASADSDHSNTL
eukprot:2944736-Rhodomonas_salina.1